MCQFAIVQHFISLTTNLCSLSRQPHFPSMGDYSAEAWLQYTNTPPSYLPTDHHTQNTHTHQNTSVDPQQWSRYCGGRKLRKRPPLCVCCRLRLKNLLTTRLLRQRQRRRAAAEVTLFTANYCWTAFLDHTPEKTVIMLVHLYDILKLCTEQIHNTAAISQ